MATANAIKAGEAYINMGLDDKEFATGLDRMTYIFENAGKKMVGVGAAISAAGLGLLSPFVAGFQQMMTYTAEIQRSAERTGIAGEEMAKLAVAADLVGSSFQALEVGLKTIGERVLQLRAGSGETVDAFRLLGIGVNDFLNASSTTDRLVMIAKRMATIKDAGLQAGLALRTLGESGNQLLPLLRLGGDLEGIFQRSSGISATQEELDTSLKLSIAWKQAVIAVQQVFVSLGATVSSVVIPALDAVTDILTGFIAFIREFSGVFQILFVIGVALLAIGSALTVIGGLLIFVKIATMAWAFAQGLVATAMTITLAPIYALLAVLMLIVGAAIAVAAYFGDAFAGGIKFVTRITRTLYTLIDGFISLGRALNEIADFMFGVRPLQGMIDDADEMNLKMLQWGEKINSGITEPVAEANNALGNMSSILSKSQGSFGQYANAQTMGSAGEMSMQASLTQLNATASEGNNLLTQIVNNTGAKGGFK